MTPEPLLAVLRDIEKPPGGWTYTVPETGVVITGDFFSSDLWPKIVKHHEANGLPAPEREIVEDRACRESPGGRCGTRQPKPVAGMPVALLSTAERFLKCVWASLVARDFVPREEAERRLGICLECPLRSTTPGGCTGCYTLLKKANSLMESKGALVIPPDENGTVRDSCSACWCLVSVKPWMSQKTLNKCESESRPPYHPNCWRLEP